MLKTGKRLALGLTLLLTNAAYAIDDTPDNRATQSDRYLQTVPPQSMMGEMASKMAQTLPADQREDFKQLMTKYLDMAKVTTAIRSSMVKTFTADELAALADFYGSPVGKSAMSKMPDYMAEVMPATMSEIQAALVKAQTEVAKKQQ